MPLTIKPSSGSGSSTLISVAGTTTNDTLTLPAKTGNIITSADSGTVTSGMLASGAITRTNLPVGSVVQVVSTSYTTQTSTTSQTLQDSGASISITPTSATNKILVIVKCSYFIDRAGVSASYVFGRVALVRNTTQIDENMMSVNTGSVNPTDISGTGMLMTLDSPATTSATTYKMQYSSLTNAFSTTVQWSGRATTITAMEIVA